ncbi:hypothetical protein OIU78_005976 [Salix suchowensis]|nr:hypothetical protein OIU78_005976 [Salix suchowensis]
MLVLVISTYTTSSMLKSSICLVYSVGKLFRAFHKKMLDSGKQIMILHSRAVHVEDSITPELAFTLTLRKFDWEYGKIPIWDEFEGLASWI